MLYNVHDNLQHLPVEELKEINYKDRAGFAVCTFNEGDLNVGMIIRTANLLGAVKVIVIGKKQFDRRSAVGSHHYIDTEFIKCENELGEVDVDEFKSCMRKNNFIPFMIETGGSPISEMRGHAKWLRPYIPCLVFGKESSGIPEPIKELGSIFTIKQFGVIRNLNVSAAASIAMYEMGRE